MSNGRQLKRLYVCAVLAGLLGLGACGESGNAPLSPEVGYLAKPAISKPGAWAKLTPVPTRPFSFGVEGLCAGVLGNKIVAATGYDGGDSDLTRIYDISSDTWSAGAVAPGINSEGAAAVHGGLLYVIGGRGAGFNANWAYDPTTDSWNAGLAPLPTGRAGLATAVVGNAIYAIGGRTNTGGPNSPGKLSVVERYDIDTDTWTPMAPLLSPRSDLAAATVGGKIYVFGGFDAFGTVVGDVDVYDPVTNAWSAAPTDLPTPRGAPYSVATKGGEVYVIGGWDGGPFTPVTGSAVESYKAATDTWTVGHPPMPTPRAEAQAVGHGGRIYVLGGAQPGFGASVAANEVFKP